MLDKISQNPLNPGSPIDVLQKNLEEVKAELTNRHIGHWNMYELVVAILAMMGGLPHYLCHECLICVAHNNAPRVAEFQEKFLVLLKRLSVTPDQISERIRNKVAWQAFLASDWQGMEDSTSTGCHFNLMESLVEILYEREKRTRRY